MSVVPCDAPDAASLSPPDGTTTDALIPTPSTTRRTWARPRVITGTFGLETTAKSVNTYDTGPSGPS